LIDALEDAQGKNVEVKSSARILKFRDLISKWSGPGVGINTTRWPPDSDGKENIEGKPKQ